MISIGQNDTELSKSVCGGLLKEPARYPSAVFHEEKIYFCNSACLKAFLKEPEAFMAGEVEHPDSEEEV